MKLGDYLNVAELHTLMASRHIRMQRHPSLPMAILNYTNECTFDDFWPDTIQKCRGLIIDAVATHEPCPDCEIVSRPFHKFFNLNHTSQPDYLEANLPSVVPTVTEKMDGWFGIMWKCISVDNENGDTHYGISSRGSFTSPGAEFATQKLQKLVKYGAVEEFPAGFTPVFEIIFKDGKVVIDYPFEGLVLLSLVNNETGEEMPYDDLQLVWAKIAGYSKDKPWIRLVKAHRMGLAECRTYDSIGPAKKDKEGFVLSYPRPGTFPIKVKIKLEEYKRLHRLITGITPQQIWESLHDPMSQWLGNGVPDHFKKWAVKWRNELYTKFHADLTATNLALEELSQQETLDRQLDPDQWINERDRRKTRVERLQEISPAYVSVAMNILDSKFYEAYQAIWNAIRPIGRESETFYREGQGE